MRRRRRRRRRRRIVTAGELVELENYQRRGEGEGKGGGGGGDGMRNGIQVAGRARKSPSLPPCLRLGEGEKRRHKFSEFATKIV